MTQLKINTGNTPNDKSADSLFSAFNKVNANFTELYGLVGTGGGSLTQEMVQDYAAAMFTNGTHTGISIVYNDAANVIDLAVDSLVNLDGGSASSVYGQEDMLIDGGSA
jgi:hypothetical protein